MKKAVVVSTIFFLFLFSQQSFHQTNNNKTYNISISQKLNINSNTKKDLDLPLRDIAVKIFQYSGLELVNDAKADYNLIIELVADGILVEYTKIGGRYTGASVSGSLTIKSNEKIISKNTFKGRAEPPSILTVFEGHKDVANKTPEQAPINTAFANSNFYSELFDIVFKISDITAINKATNDEDVLISTNAFKILFHNRNKFSSETNLGITNQFYNYLQKTIETNINNAISKSIDLIILYNLQLPSDIFTKLINKAGVSDAINLIKKRKTPDSVELLLSLLARSESSESSQILSLLKQYNDPKISEEIRKSLFNKLSNKDKWARKDAVTQIKYNKYEVPIDVIENLMNDNSIEVRNEAVSLLYYCYNQKCIDLILNNLSRLNDITASNTIRALHKFNNSKIDDVLINYNLTNETIINAVIEYFSKRKNSRSVELLLKLAQNKNDNIRTRAVNSLGTIDESRVTKLMIELTNDPSESVRSAAIANLGQLNDNVAVEQLIYLINTSSDPLTKRNAVNAIGYSNNQLALFPLLTIYNESINDERLHGSAFEALTLILSKVKIISSLSEAKLLVKLIHEKNKRLHDVYRRFISSLSDSTSIRYLKESLADNNENTAIAVAITFQHIKNYKVDDILINALNNELRWKVRYRLIQSISLQNIERSIPLIIPMLKDSIYNMREMAAYALGLLQAKQAVPNLIESLRDTSRFVRYQAVSALGKIKDTTSASAIVEALNKEKITTNRVYYVEALGNIGGKYAVQTLMNISKNSIDSKILANAIRSLGILKSEEAIDILIDIMIKNETQRGNTIDALKKINSKKATEKLIDALEDENVYVQIAAAKVLGSLNDWRAIEPLIELLENGKRDNLESAIQSALVGITNVENIRGYKNWFDWWDENESRFVK